MDEQGNIIIYQSEDGVVRLDVRLEDNTVWLTIDQMAELFGKSRSTINEHILHIYEEGELEESKTKRKIGISDFSTKPTNLYNLDVIISVGYRVKSIQGTRFRQWATERLNEHNRKAYKLASLLMAQGKTYTEISRELNENGYKTSTGKTWQTVQVQRLMALYK